MKTLVLGLGNLLLCDEGVGVHAARALAEAGGPEGVTVLGIGTAILDALEAIEQADRIIVVDAVMAEGGVPGSIYRMHLDAFVTPQSIASMHGFDLSRVLRLTGRTAPPEVVVIGVEPAKIDWSLELSPVVAEVLSKVVEIVLEEIRGQLD
jgi:hydrogenase maturation protease